MPNFLLTIFQLMSYAIPRDEISDRLAYYVTVLLAMFAGKLVTVGMRASLQLPLVASDP